MSEFLFILPTGWEQVTPADVDTIEGGMSAIRSHLSSGTLADLSSLFIASGRLVEPAYIVEARLLNDDILVIRTAV